MLIAPVMRYARYIMIDHSYHWSHEQKPQPRPALRMYSPQHLIAATTAPQRRIVRGGESGGNAGALRRWGNVAMGVDSYGVGADRGLSQGAAHRGAKLRGRFVGPLGLGAG